MASSAADTVIDWEKAVVHDHNYPKMHMFHARNVMFANASRPLPTIYLFKNDAAEVIHEPSSKKLKLEPVEESGSQEESDLEEEEELDVMTFDKVPDLPYDENKVRSVMVECEKYVSLVRLVAKHHHQEEINLDGCSPQQKKLYTQLFDLLKDGHLAKLACEDVPHEPIKRRLHIDGVAQKFRRVLTEIKWDRELTRWVHEVFLQSLDYNLLPVYLDVLQVLRAKVHRPFYIGNYECCV